MTDETSPYHCHIYYAAEQRPDAEALRERFIAYSAPGSVPQILFVGRLMDAGVGPHPIAQFEIHFLKQALGEVVPIVEASGLRALIHPLTDDDLADHTSLGHWIGEPLDLDLSVLDPPGRNQGIPRFGTTDF